MCNVCHELTDIRKQTLGFHSSFIDLQHSENNAESKSTSHVLQYHGNVLQNNFADLHCLIKLMNLVAENNNCFYQIV